MVFMCALRKRVIKFFISRELIYHVWLACFFAHVVKTFNSAKALKVFRGRSRG